MRTPRPPRLAAFAAAFLISLTGCGDGAPEVPPEVARARQQSARRACVAAEVLRRASSDIADLRETLETSSEDSPGAELTRRAGTAALQFARAYEQHAELRLAAYAHVDSAVNYSRRAADSIQHVQMAQQLSIRSPQPGTVEANVIAAYERDLASLLRDPDHPCNWDL